MKRYLTAWITLLGVWCLLPGAAQAFDGPGHHLATRGAVAALPGDMPAFFRQSAKDIASGSLDPDVFKHDDLLQLDNAESPEHYFDLELLDGAPVPETRYAFIGLCAKKGLQPSKVGTLPYALAEWTQRLTVAFAEYRRWPDNPHLQARCLVYAGFLAHYAQDACQPLHTTIHYDGRVGPDGKSPRTGIHGSVDALIEKAGLDPAGIAEQIRPEPFERVWPAILRQLDRSHALVDRVYDLEAALPGRHEPMPASPQVVAFGRDRLLAASRFTASLYLTAWRDSAKLPLARYHLKNREETEHPAASQPVRRSQGR